MGGRGDRLGRPAFREGRGHFSAMLRGAWRVLAPRGLFFCRLASSIGIGDRVRSIGNGRYRLPDGSDRYLVDEPRSARVDRAARRRPRGSDQDHGRAGSAGDDDLGRAKALTAFDRGERRWTTSGHCCATPWQPWPTARPRRCATRPRGLRRFRQARQRCQAPRCERRCRCWPTCATFSTGRCRSRRVSRWPRSG